MPIVAGIFVGLIFGFLLAWAGLGAALIALPILGAIVGAWTMWAYRSTVMDPRSEAQVEETLKKDRARWGIK